MFHRLVLAFLASCFFGNPTALFAQNPPVSIQILTTFDYPGGSIATFPAKMNEHGDVAGGCIDPASGLQRGFVRYRDGSFSPPIAPPFAVGSYTQANDIDNWRAFCGFFSDPSDTVFHGYFFADGTFTQFDIDGGVSTFLNSLNDSGEFAGSFDLDTGITMAFVGHDGIIESFGIPGASFTGASSVNDLGEVVGNYVIGTETNSHGYIRDPAGNLTFPIDFPGPLGIFGTTVRAENHQGWIVGGYYDRNLKEHGFLYRRAYGFVAYDYPDATRTRLTGINNAGLICGSYVDSELGRRHGFIARLR